MKPASKSNLSLNNLKILSPKVTKNVTNLHKKFCESPPCSLNNFFLVENVKSNSLLFTRTENPSNQFTSNKTMTSLPQGQGRLYFKALRSDRLVSV